MPQVASRQPTYSQPPLQGQTRALQERAAVSRLRERVQPLPASPARSSKLPGIPSATSAQQRCWRQKKESPVAARHLAARRTASAQTWAAPQDDLENRPGMARAKRLRLLAAEPAARTNFVPKAQRPARPLQAAAPGPPYTRESPQAASGPGASGKT